MIIGYVTADPDSFDEASEDLSIYANKKNIKINQIVCDDVDARNHWAKRKLHALLSNADAGDEFIVRHASDLARSTMQVIEVLHFLASKGLVLHLVKYDQVFTPDRVYDTEKFLLLMRCVEGEFVAKRTTDALARRRSAGLPLGRPKGRKNKRRKLDKHREEIKKYLALNINKASIAKLVGCHAQTLYNYLEDTDLAAEVDRDRQSIIASANDLTMLEVIK